MSSEAPLLAADDEAAHADPPATPDNPIPHQRLRQPGAREARNELTATLFQRSFETTSEAERAALQEEIIHLHLAVARSAASRYRNRGVPLEDLEQIACTGLVLAVQRFDPRVGESFLSFALPTIQGMLKRHFRDHGWAVRPPRRVQHLQSRISSSREELTQLLGRSPQLDEIAEHLDVDLDEVIEALAARGCFTPVSLDRLVGGVESESRDTVGDLIAALDEPLNAAEARVMLMPLIRQLSERDRRILAMRFFEQRTQQDIGTELGVSQIQVSRLLSRILRDLRRMLTEGQESAPSRRAS